MFKPFKKRRTFEEISAEIKGLIIQGVLKPGDKLPSEAEIARQFNVGRQTIREALRLLELSGFITIRRGIAGGPLIVDTIIDSLRNSLLDAIYMRKITIEDLTTARLEIEKVVLKHVLENVDKSDIKILKQNIYRAKEKIEKRIQPFDENVQFHVLLARASRNHIFIIVVESIMAIVADFLSRTEQDLEHSGNVVRIHENILDAIIERKSDEAISLLEGHLLEVKTRL